MKYVINVHGGNETPSALFLRGFIFSLFSACPTEALQRRSFLPASLSVYCLVFLSLSPVSWLKDFCQFLSVYFLFGKRRKKMCISLSQQWRSSWKLCFSILADLSHYSPSCSVAKSCLALCDPMDCGMPGSPVLHIRWLECWSFSISCSNEYSGLISLRIDWIDVLVIQETLVSLLQNHNLEASILQDLAFFMVLLSNLSVREY